MLGICCDRSLCFHSRIIPPDAPHIINKFILSYPEIIIEEKETVGLLQGQRQESPFHFFFLAGCFLQIKKNVYVDTECARSAYSKMFNFDFCSGFRSTFSIKMFLIKAK